MYCKRCNVKVPDIAKFCPKCGGSVTQEQRSPSNISSYPEYGQTEVLTEDYEDDRYSQPHVQHISDGGGTGDYTEVYEKSKPSAQPGKRKKALLTAFLAVVICIAVLGLGFLAINILRSTIWKKDAYPQRESLMIVEEEEGVLIYGDAEEPVEIDEELYYSLLSQDGTKACILTAYNDEKSEMKVWYTDGKDAVEVVDNASQTWQSPLGNKIAYTIRQGSKEAYDLFIYDCQSGDTKELSDSSGNQYFVFSPDGETYAFCSDVKNSEEGYVDSLVMYISADGGKPTAFGKNIFPVAISDDVHYLYYVDRGSDLSGYTLYVQKNGQENKLSKEDSHTFYLNRDCSQIIYYKNSNTYTSIDGMSGERISSDEIYFLFPQNLQSKQNYNFYSGNTDINLYSYTYNIEKFSDQLFIAYGEDYSLGYMDSDYVEREIDDLSDNPTFDITSDGESLAYVTDSGKVIYLADYRNTKKEPISIRTETDVSDLQISGDKSVIYFKDIENTLWAVRGENEPEEIAYELSGFSQNSSDNKGIYFISEWESTSTQSNYETGGTLNYLANKEESKPVEIEDLVYNFNVLHSGITFSIITKYDEKESGYLSDTYYSLNGKSADAFEMVAEDVLIN